MIQKKYNQRLSADFSKAADVYGLHARHQYLNYAKLKTFYDKILANHRAPIFDPMYFFDLGIGDGGGLKQYWFDVIQSSSVFALDLSHKMLKNCPEDFLKINCNLSQLPLKPKSMHRVISSFALHWLDDLPGFFRDLRFVLHEDGLAVLSFPVAGSLQALTSAWAQVGALSPVHHFPDYHQTLELIDSNDFKILNAYQEDQVVRFNSGMDVLKWLKITGARSKSVNQQFTKSQLKGAIDALENGSSQSVALKFKTAFVAFKPATN